MKFFSANLRFLAILIAFSIFQHTSLAQEGRLPTKKELDIQDTCEMLYRSGNTARNGGDTHIMVTGPQQNCNGAIPVCNSAYTQTSSYTGHGTIQEVSNTCLGTQETNSVWYVFTVQNS